MWAVVLVQNLVSNLKIDCKYKLTTIPYRKSDKRQLIDIEFYDFVCPSTTLQMVNPHYKNPSNH